ncbi:EAL domain-containing protein [Planococcus sp. SE5232]|uniref:EAL domain-containing protein n=1 Tax=unclassified Planococcus (in: firmicutes) TaxID=2662419 RepID=UPI003D6BE7D4
MKKDTGLLKEWMNTNDEFLIAIDGDGLILQVNQAWIDFCTFHEVTEALWKIGANYLEQLEINGNEKKLHSFKSLLAKEISEYKKIFPFPLGNGDIQWFQVNIRGTKDPSGHSHGAIVKHKPITLHATQPITAETILESMTDGFYLLDDHLHVIYINEIAEKLLKTERGSVVGRGLYERFSEAIGTAFDYQYKHALKEKVIIEFVEYYKPLDMWFQVKVYPLEEGSLAVYFQDVSDRKKIETQLAESAYFDYLTGLPNRRSLNHTTRLLRAQGKQFSIFHLNLDNLNSINAVHDYNAGDDVIKKVASELQGLICEKCQIARMDGNEFIIQKEDSPRDDQEELAEKIAKVFSKPITLDSNQEIHVIISIGIACYPLDSSAMNEVYSYAEMAMREAKITRGSSYAFFQPMMRTLYNRNSTIEEGLTGDLKKNGFYYTMQPQIDGHSGDIIGIEILSRWAHPKLGEISPLEFIQVAEETGDIIPLTSHLLKEVFTQLKDWENRYGWSLRTAFNMTPSLLNNSNFFDSFFELIDQYKVDPTLIEIEITEQAELTYSSKTLENLILCKSKGISIAIDDFGTGFSMISYLTSFPIDKIKIDKSFIEKIGQDRKSEAVLKSLIHLAKSIECELVAEGVERIEEANFLLANDCNVFQGYLYDKPLNIREFEKKYLQADHKSPAANDRL